MKFAMPRLLVRHSILLLVALAMLVLQNYRIRRVPRVVPQGE